MNKKRIIFWGTPAVAAQCLEELLAADLDVVAVISQPDKPVGRKRIIAATPTKQVALDHGIPVLQPAKLKTEEFAQEITDLKPDLCVVVAYGRIIPMAILEIPQYFINLHFSLLPKYRGAAPFQRAILEGQTMTGITVQHLEMELDTGDIIIQKELPIEKDETSLDLLIKATNFGKKELLLAIKQLSLGTAERVAQDDSQATHAAKITKETGYVEWHKSAAEIYNQYRACYPSPGLTTSLAGKNIKLKKIAVTSHKKVDKPAGTVEIDGKEIYVVTGQGTLQILEIQPANKPKMTAEAFLSGYRSQLQNFEIITTK